MAVMLKMGKLEIDELERARRVTRYQVLCASTPPSTTRLAPVIQRAAGEARKSTASATSLGWPSRSSGAAACQRATPSGHDSSIPGASIRPGDTQLTLIPARPELERGGARVHDHGRLRRGVVAVVERRLAGPRSRRC